MHKTEKNCLTDTELGAYIEDNMTLSEKEDVERRLLLCDQCREDFIALQRVLIREDITVAGEVPERLVQKAISIWPDKKNVFDMVLTFVQDSIKIISCAHDMWLVTPRYSEGLRSGISTPSEIIVLKKSFENINVRFDIEKVEKDLCCIRVSVDETDGNKATGTYRVGLLSRGRELVSGLLENGETFLEDIGQGEYVIIIQNREKVIGEVALKIK